MPSTPVASATIAKVGIPIRPDRRNTTSLSSDSAANALGRRSGPECRRSCGAGWGLDDGVTTMTVRALPCRPSRAYDRLPNSPQTVAGPALSLARWCFGVFARSVASVPGGYVFGRPDGVVIIIVVWVVSGSVTGFGALSRRVSRRSVLDVVATTALMAALLLSGVPARVGFRGA